MRGKDLPNANWSRDVATFPVLVWLIYNSYLPSYIPWGLTLSDHNTARLYNKQLKIFHLLKHKIVKKNDIKNTDVEKQLK